MLSALSMASTRAHGETRWYQDHERTKTVPSFMVAQIWGQPQCVHVKSWYFLQKVLFEIFLMYIGQPL